MTMIWLRQRQEHGGNKSLILRCPTIQPYTTSSPVLGNSYRNGDTYMILKAENVVSSTEDSRIQKIADEIGRKLPELTLVERYYYAAKVYAISQRSLYMKGI